MSNAIAHLQKQASLLLQHGHIKKAIEAHQLLLNLQPGHAPTLYNLAYLLKIDGQYQNALDAYEQALLYGISQPEEVHLNRAVIYSDNLRLDSDAERELKHALTIAPHYAPALLNLGNLYEEQGKRQQAIHQYQGILALSNNDLNKDDSIYLSALARLAHLKPPNDLNDEQFNLLQKAARNAKSGEDRANLYFALGRAFDALGDYNSAFSALSNANLAVKSSGPPYNRKMIEHTIDSLIAAFPAVQIEQQQDIVIANHAPLFICGMYRSGSTLVEQVLAAHRHVLAGGELDLLPKLLRTLAPFPQSVSRIEDKQFQIMASNYLEQLKLIFHPDKQIRYITDKRPDNFMLIGLIKRLFPAAKIIHTTRNPLDNGLSVFMQHLHPNIAGYACDLADIGHYYAQYKRLMNHWQCLYKDSIIQFDYDSFVTAPNKALADLLEFLDLEMDDQCLSFHKLDNTVKTASYWQVRQPLYNNASGRWRFYQNHLIPLEQELLKQQIDY
jgi:tetratricopeptide (TPR) repeat protein